MACSSPSAAARRSLTDRRPGWSAGRTGAVRVAADCRIVVVEGVGAGRRDLADLVDALVWVQSDAADARTRGLARGGDDHVAFWDEWDAEEVPFLAAHRPWERADVVLAGTPVLDHEPASEVVVAPRTVVVRTLSPRGRLRRIHPPTAIGAGPRGGASGCARRRTVGRRGAHYGVLASSSDPL